MVFGFKNVFPVDKLGQNSEAEVLGVNPNHKRTKNSYVRMYALVLTMEVDQRNSISSKMLLFRK